MRRRAFMTLIGGAAVAWPLAVHAQQLGVPVIGWLSPGSRDADQFRLSALERGLAEAAYVTGKNVALEYRWAEGQDSRLLSLAADLTQRRVNVIVAAGVAAFHPPGAGARDGA